MTELRGEENQKFTSWAELAGEADKIITEKANLMQGHRGIFECVNVPQMMSTNFTPF